MPPRTRYAKSRDVRIAHQVVGDDSLDLVFVPGFGSELMAERLRESKVETLDVVATPAPTRSALVSVPPDAHRPGGRSRSRIDRAYGVPTHATDAEFGA
jgi:hypothetical protein